MTAIAPWFVLPTQSKRCEQAVVLGAGLAGCHVAFELAERDVHVQLLDAGVNVAAGASGNTVGIVKPFVTREPHDTNAFYLSAFDFLINRLTNNASLKRQAEFNACGVLQLLEHRYPENKAYQVCDAAQASKIAGLPIDSHAIYFARGGYLNPKALCSAIVKHPNIDLQLNTPISDMVRKHSQWQLQQAGDKPPIVCDTLILANGEQLNRFDQTRELPITPARGQTSCFAMNTMHDRQTLPEYLLSDNEPSSGAMHTGVLQTVVTGKRYAIPCDSSVIVGASFARNNQNTELTDEDHAANLQGLTSLLPSIDVRADAIAGFCGTRATTPDRLPDVGPVPDFQAYRQNYELIRNGLPAEEFKNATYQDNLFVIGGFGSRGIVSAPYCAMLLAEHICNVKTPENTPASNASESNSSVSISTASSSSTSNPSENQDRSAGDLSSWSTLIHPGRFIIRDLKRARPLIYSNQQ